MYRIFIICIILSSCSSDSKRTENKYGNLNNERLKNNFFVINDTSGTENGGFKITTKYYDGNGGLILVMESDGNKQKLFPFFDCPDSYESNYIKGQMLFSEYLNQRYIFDGKSPLEAFRQSYKSSDSVSFYSIIDSILFRYYKIKWNAHQRRCFNTFIKAQ